MKMNGSIVFLASIFALSALQVGSAPLENETQERANICGSSGAREITKWPGNVVPYMIGSNFTAFARASLVSSIYQLENDTCILFIPRTHETDYVLFKMSTRCCSHPGKMGPGKQEVYFSDHCLQEGVSIKRVLQALIGGSTPRVIAEPDPESHSIPQNPTPQQQTNSQTVASGCTNSCSKCIFPQPPSGDSADSSSGVISSPSYPSFYPGNSDCVTKLVAPIGYFISLSFMADMDIEAPDSQDNCKYDYLDLSFFDVSGEPLANISRFCGSNSASKLNSALESSDELQSQAVIVHFHSDSNYAGKGFLLGYSLQANHSDDFTTFNPCAINNSGCEQVCSDDGYTNGTCSCRVGYKLAEDGYSCQDVDECELKYKEGGCQQRCANSAGSYQCYCRPGHRLAEDGRNCLECGGEFNNSRGVIQSQNFPLSYPAQQNCKWKVFASPDHLLRISIKHMDIFRSTRCTEDFLKVEKGHFPNQRRLCGHYSDITYVVEDSIYFRFRSRNSNTKRDGFLLEYSQVHPSELSSLERNYVTVNNRHIPHDNRLWILSL